MRIKSLKKKREIKKKRRDDKKDGGGAALLFAGADIHFSAELINSIKIDGSVVLAALRCTSAILLYGHEAHLQHRVCTCTKKCICMVQMY